MQNKIKKFIRNVWLNSKPFIIRMRYMLENAYWGDNKQELHFYTYTDLKYLKKSKRFMYTFDDIFCNDYFCFTIQTLDCVEPELWGSTPYILSKDSFVTITVHKFGNLTEDDIKKAIKKYLKYIDCFCINAFWNNKLF